MLIVRHINVHLYRYIFHYCIYLYFDFFRLMPQEVEMKGGDWRQSMKHRLKYNKILILNLRVTSQKIFRTFHSIIHTYEYNDSRKMKYLT